MILVTDMKTQCLCLSWVIRVIHIAERLIMCLHLSCTLVVMGRNFRLITILLIKSLPLIIVLLAIE